MEKIIIKSTEDKTIFLTALANPPEPGEGLKKAKEMYKKYFESVDGSDPIIIDDAQYMPFNKA